MHKRRPTALSLGASAATQLERSLTAVLEISQAINLSLGPGEMLQLLAEKIHRLMGFDCAVILLDPDSLLLTWAGSYGLSEGYIRAMNDQHNNLRTPEMAQGATGRAYRERRPAAITDLRDSAVRLWRDQAAREGIVTFVATPMTLHERVLGFVNCYTRVAHVYSPSELELLQIIANQAAVAVEAARLHDQQRQRAAELERLNGVLSEQHGLLERQNAQLLQAERIHDQLTEVILRDSGLEAIVDRIAELIGRPVVLYDADLRQLAASRRQSPTDRLQEVTTASGRLPRELLDRAGPPAAAGRLLDEGRATRLIWSRDDGAEFPRYAVPVATGRSAAGYLLVTEAPGDLAALDLRAVEHGATAVALELLKQRAVVQVEQQLRGGFLDDLLAGQYGGEESVIRRAKHLGFDLTASYRVMLIGLDPSTGDGAAGGLGDLSHHEPRHRVLYAAQASCAARYPTGILSPKGDAIAFLWPADPRASIGPGEAARTLADEITRSVRRATVSIGIGSPCREPADFARSYAEARHCLDVLRRFGNAERVLAIEELGIHRFLLHSRDSELLALAHRRLDRLLEHDHQPGVRFLETLQAYLALECSLTRTARQLALHVNTVQYHLRRTEELSGLRLRSPEGLMEMQLALTVASLDPKSFPTFEPYHPGRTLGAQPSQI